MQSAGSTNITNDSQTSDQYRTVFNRCKDLYLRKVQDYGTSWRVLRPVSIVDQVYIKAWRIRQIQEKKVQRIGDSIESEFVGIVNYGIIALIQHHLSPEAPFELSAGEAKDLYETQAGAVEALMLEKNHDYGEAWRSMSQESFTDLILTKLMRIRQIIANDGQTQVSEGADANFADIVNYAIFALILIKEKG